MLHWLLGDYYIEVVVTIILFSMQWPLDSDYIAQTKRWVSTTLGST